MSKLTEWSFRNKAAIWLLVVMALVMGLMSYFRLPMEFLPEADNPQVVITAIGQGSNASSMEEKVTNPLEQSVMFVKGKTSMSSTSGDGYTQIFLNFDSKANMKEAKAEVERAVTAVQLPPNVIKPFVLQLNTSMIPISWVTISFDESISDQEREKKLVEVKNELQKVEGSGGISVSGQSHAVVKITPDSEKLSQTGIPIQSLMTVLQGRGVSTSLGERIVDGQSANLTITDEITDIDTLKSLPIAPGKVLSDVASVELSNESENVSRKNGKEVVVFIVSKAANANSVSVSEGIEETVTRLDKDMAGIEASVMLSSSDTVVHAVDSMLREVLLGALFATIIILLFMRNVKATIVTIVSIPLSLAITLYLLQLSGVSLNIITLGGVAVAVGRLVDDSIVVIENIYRRLQNEPFSVSLIISATKEVASAITSSTIVTVAVFLPMGLLKGSLQAFLLPFALTVTYSLLASLLVALTVVPLLSALLLRGTKEKENSGSPKFAAFLRWNLSRKWLPIFIAIVLLVGSVGAYVTMPKGAIDSSSAEYLNVTLQYPSDTPTDQVLVGGMKLEGLIMKDESVEWITMDSGNSSDGEQFGNVTSPTLVSYLVELKADVDAELFLERLTAKQADFPEAELQANTTDLIMGSGPPSVFIDVTGDDPNLLAETAKKLTEAIVPVKGVLKVESNQEAVKPVYTYEINPEVAKGEEVAMQLQSVLHPMPIGTLSLKEGETPVILQPITNPQSAADLDKLVIMTATGAVPISEVAELVRTEQPSVFYHLDGKPYVRVTASADPKQLSIVGEDITKVTKELELPAGVEISVGGASADQMSDFADIGATALISIGIVYLIMVLTFKTLRAPLAIMISLPLAAIGAVTALLISGITPDFTAMFGALMLIGIVVTNAIVLIDRVKHNEQSMPIREALIEAATTRMRPIIMTALATICAMLPLVFGSHESGSIVSQSLAIVVIGGLAAATVLTLIIVPCVYELLFFRKSAKQRKIIERDGAAEAAAASSK
ncbi:efflux RND transporter permease subunit [Paenibacillus sp. L3-i20]|uniref:efflux RND transporter permease subunit n=1 Tax=Paenibacillus sp. L3-i20 TaxID=2905833 RepID=UPI001EDF66CF|nr:efflux RND transporter permease subunit [Paenibacillus sp. L3-i20]GKU78445.1 multidrug transporter AcrB [Paenibacillus sp. L3-i20]